MEIPRSFPLIDENFYVKNNITYEELMFLWRSAFITIQEGLIGVVTESLRICSFITLLQKRFGNFSYS